MKTFMILLLFLVSQLSFGRTVFWDANTYDINSLGTLSDVEFFYLKGVTSNIQTQFAGKQNNLTNSAGLAGALSDETGTGFSVFSASPALTGTPTAPTATPGDNSTKIATTAYADAAVAGSSVVHTTGNESISGTKTFTGKIIASSTTNGAQPCPVMTEVQRNAIAAPSNGDCIFNSTSSKLNVYNSSLASWKEVSGSGGSNSILTNTGFEDGSTGWSTTTVTPSSSTTVKVEGEKSLCFTATAQAWTLTQSSTTNAAQFADGIQGLAAIRLKSNHTGIITVCSIQAGTVSTTDCYAIPATELDNKWKLYRIPFILGGTSNGISVSAASGTGTTCLDDAKVEMVSDFDQSPVVLNTISYTPTLTNLGNAVASNFKYWFVGKYFYLRGNITIGSTLPNSTGMTISLPSGITFPVSDGVVGYAGRTGSSNTHIGQIRPASTTTFQIWKDAAGGSWKNSVPLTWNAGDTFEVVIQDLPMDGRDSTINTFTDQCQSDIDCTNTFTAEISPTGSISNQNVSGWLTSCTNANPRVCTITTGVFASGTTPSCQATVNNASFRLANLSAVSATSFTFDAFVPNTGATSGASTTITCSRGSGDFKARKQIVGSFKNVTKTIGMNSPKECVSAYAGATFNVGCSSSPCTEYYDSCGSASSTRTSSGLYVTTWASGTWANNALIECSGYTSGNGGPASTDFYATASGGFSLTSRAYATGGTTATDNSFVVRCKGESP